VTCPAFSSPDSLTIVQFPLEKLPSLIFDKAFNASTPTVIYFHGWITNPVNDPSIHSMMSAYRGFNFVAINWYFYAKDIRYFSSTIPQLKIVGFCH
jgi:hypothetical protein